jgi:hypothetical protein
MTSSVTSRRHGGPYQRRTICDGLDTSEPALSLCGKWGNYDCG